MSRPVLASVLVVCGLAAVGCSANVDVPEGEEAATSEDALRTTVTPGTFKLYDAPNTQPSPTCDLHTVLDLKQVGFHGVAALKSALIGTCRIAVPADAREYKLTRETTSCGSKIYSGTRRINGRLASVKVTDHRSRTCRDLVPAQVILEETLPGFPGAITQTFYGSEASPPPPATCRFDAQCGDGQICQPGLCRMHCLPGATNCCAPSRCAAAPAGGCAGKSESQCNAARECEALYGPSVCSPSGLCTADHRYHGCEARPALTGSFPAGDGTSLSGKLYDAMKTHALANPGATVNFVQAFGGSTVTFAKDGTTVSCSAAVLATGLRHTCTFDVAPGGFAWTSASDSVPAELYEAIRTTGRTAELVEGDAMLRCEGATLGMAQVMSYRCDVAFAN